MTNKKGDFGYVIELLGHTLLYNEVHRGKYVKNGDKEEVNRLRIRVRELKRAIAILKSKPIIKYAVIKNGDIKYTFDTEEGAQGDVDIVVEHLEGKREDFTVKKVEIREVS